MQIVIDISEDLYEGIERRDGALETEYVCDELMKAVDVGTPLPKGHGELIDKDIVIDMMNRGVLEEYMTVMGGVIPADR